MKKVSMLFCLAVVMSFSGCRFFSGKSAEEARKEAEIKARYAVVAARPRTGKTIFAFMGKPGSGKGTLAEQAARVLGFKKVSTGDLCRVEIASGTERGKAIENTIKEGRLVQDEMMTSMVDEWLEREGKENTNIILDGYPRTQKQAEMILDVLKDKYTDFMLRVVVLDISDEEVFARLANRLMCENKKCQAVFTRMRLDLICPVCGSMLAPRVDDKEAVVRDRIALYVKHADMLIPFYKTAGFMVDTISVSGLNRDEVYDKFRKILPEEAEQK